MNYRYDYELTAGIVLAPSLELLECHCLVHDQSWKHPAWDKWRIKLKFSYNASLTPSGALPVNSISAAMASSSMRSSMV